MIFYLYILYIYSYMGFVFILGICFNCDLFLMNSLFIYILYLCLCLFFFFCLKEVISYIILY